MDQRGIMVSVISHTNWQYGEHERDGCNIN